MLFHHSVAFLEQGDVVASGNWGRVVQGYGGFHSQFLRETLWELVRQREFSTSPSRLSCAFCYDDENEARAGMGVSHPPELIPNLYEVELVVPDAPFLRANLDLLENMWRAAHTTFEAEEIVRKYWRGDMPTERAECLTASDLRVVRVIERSRPR